MRYRCAGSRVSKAKVIASYPLCSRDSAPANSRQPRAAALRSQAASALPRATARHRAHAGAAIAGADAGAILCYRGGERGRTAHDAAGHYVDSDAAWIYWTHVKEPIFAWATRADGDGAALYDWWSQTARFIAP